MKRSAHKIVALAVLAWLLGPARVNSQLQSIPLKGTASDLSAVTYFDPPHEQLVKYRVTGSEMTALPEATYDVKNIRIESYNLAGKLLTVVEAPQCIYSPMDTQISSAGHLSAQLQGGVVHLEGDGFLWQQASNYLYISNNVHALIQPGTNQLIR